MASTVRTFLGIRIPATPGLGAIISDLGSLGQQLKTSRTDDLHVTLKFLGDTPRTQLFAIKAALIEAASTATSHSVELVGMGAFPSPARPSVVWAGIRPEDELRRIAGELDQRLKPLGFIPESRPYHPHLTLARIKAGPPLGLSEMLAASSNLSLGSAIIESIELYESQLTPTGTRYTSLATARLRDV